MTKPKIGSVSSGCNESFLTHAYCVSEKDAFGIEVGKGGSYPFRPNCYIKPLITGEVTLGKLADLIQSAQSSIDILVWGFDPSLRLKRTGNHSYDKNYRLGTMLEKKAIAGVAVRVRCYFAVGAGIRAQNIAGLPGGLFDLFTHDNVIDELNEIESSYAYISTWNVFQQAGKLKTDYMEVLDPETVNSDFYKKLRTYHKKHFENYMAYRRQWSIDNPDVIHYIWSSSKYPQTYGEWTKLNPKVSSSDVFPEQEFVSEFMLEYTSTPHQKMALIDFEKPIAGIEHKPSALIMGNNLKQVDWDTKEHLYENKLRDDVPRQDIASYVKGPILNDINANFQEVYNGIVGTKSKLSRQALPASLTNKPNYHNALQLCRTFVEKSEVAIHHLYANAIGQIDDYAYFENQYFRHDKLTTKLVERMKYLKSNGSQKYPHIFLVIFPAGSIGKGTTEETLAKLAKTPGWEEAKKSIEPSEIAEIEALGAKVSLCSLATSGQTNSFFGGKQWNYKAINIHTKVLISDDVFFTIGSANFNYRSMVSDNELNVACHDENTTEAFRHELMGLHMGHNYSSSLDVKDLFKEWEGLRIMNDSIIKSKKSSLTAGSKLVSYEDSGWMNLRVD